MNYEIIGGAFPAVKCTLEKGDAVKCEGGSMSWMDSGIKMSTEGGGGIGKALGRAFSGEKIFFNRYECAAGQAEIVFASSFPGCIVPVQLAAGQSIIAQKDAFLACEESVDVATHIHEKVGGGSLRPVGSLADVVRVEATGIDVGQSRERREDKPVAEHLHALVGHRGCQQPLEVLTVHEAVTGLRLLLIFHVLNGVATQDFHIHTEPHQAVEPDETGV